MRSVFPSFHLVAKYGRPRAFRVAQTLQNRGISSWLSIFYPSRRGSETPDSPSGVGKPPTATKTEKLRHAKTTLENQPGSHPREFEPAKDLTAVPSHESNASQNMASPLAQASASKEVELEKDLRTKRLQTYGEAIKSSALAAKAMLDEPSKWTKHQQEMENAFDLLKKKQSDLGTILTPEGKELYDNLAICRNIYGDLKGELKGQNLARKRAEEMFEAVSKRLARDLDKIRTTNASIQAEIDESFKGTPESSKISAAKESELSGALETERSSNISLKAEVESSKKTQKELREKFEAMKTQAKKSLAYMTKLESRMANHATRFEKLQVALRMKDAGIRNLRENMRMNKRKLVDYDRQRKFNAKLKLQIEALENERDLMQPLLNVGIAVRLRFLEQTIVADRDRTTSLGRIALEKGGNTAAHSGNGAADVILYLKGIIAAKASWLASQFEKLYLYTPEDYSSRINDPSQRNLLKVLDIEASVKRNEQLEGLPEQLTKLQEKHALGIEKLWKHVNAVLDAEVDGQPRSDNDPVFESLVKDLDLEKLTHTVGKRIHGCRPKSILDSSDVREEDEDSELYMELDGPTDENDDKDVTVNLDSDRVEDETPPTAAFEEKNAVDEKEDIEDEEQEIDEAEEETSKNRSLELPKLSRRTRIKREKQKQKILKLHNELRSEMFEAPDSAVQPHAM